MASLTLPSSGALTRAALLSLLLLLAAVVLRTAWVSDDAFITFRTVDNALNGYGLRWNVDERVQSYTHPLWMLLLLPAVGLVGSPYLASLLLSFALTGVAVALLVVLARRRPWTLAFGLTVLVFSKAFVDYSTSGLENPLSHALLAGLMVAASRARGARGPGARRQDGRLAAFARSASVSLGGALRRERRDADCQMEMPYAAGAGPPRALLLGLLAALVGLARMDLLLIAGPVALAALASSAVRWPLAPGPRPLPHHSAFCILHPASAGGSGETRRSAARRRSALLFVVGLSPLAAWTLFSIAYYGVPFPNTAYAKLSTSVPQEMLTPQGFRYLGESLDRDPLTLPVIGAAIAAPIVLLAMRIARRAGGRVEVRPSDVPGGRPGVRASEIPGDGPELRPNEVADGRTEDRPTEVADNRIDVRPFEVADGRNEEGLDEFAARGAELQFGWLLAVSVGLFVYIAYVVRIGGDFMSGRFLAAPLVVAVFALQCLPWPRRMLPGLGLVLVAASVGLSAREPSVALLTGPSTLTFEEIWKPHGVVDERSFYFDRTAFLTSNGVRTNVLDGDEYLRELIPDLRNQHPRTIVFQTVGMAGYYVGPDRHIIDTLALCDPLLARLPAIPPWRIGHYQRAIPEGYFESVDIDRNVVEDPQIAALYDRIRLATRGPLWTRERWTAIWEINVG